MSETDSAKLPKSKVGYEHPAQGEDHCGECAHYQGRRQRFGECGVVRGVVRKEDWCERFRERGNDHDKDEC